MHRTTTAAVAAAATSESRARDRATTDGGATKEVEVEERGTTRPAPNARRQFGKALSRREADTEEQDDDDDDNVGGTDGGGDHVEDQSRLRRPDGFSPGRFGYRGGRTGRSPYAHTSSGKRGANANCSVSLEDVQPGLASDSPRVEEEEEEEEEEGFLPR
jgi:hypothetical protein